MHLFRRLISVVLLVFVATFATAQEVGEEDVKAVETITQKIEQYAKQVEAARDSDQRLVELGVEIEALEKELFNRGVKLSPRLPQIKLRLDQIGPVPEEGQGEEPKSVVDERQKLVEERGRINQLLGILEEQSIRTNQLTDTISEARRQLFTDALSRRYDITEAFSTELFTDVGDSITSLTNRIHSWWQFTWRFKSQNALLGLGGVIALTLLALLGLRKIFSGWIYRDPNMVDPSYLTRLTTASWYTILPTALTWLFFLLTYLVMSFLGVLRDDIGQILSTIFVCAAIIILVWRLTEAIFAPKLKQWRLIDVSDHAARPLKTFVVLMVVVSTADVLVTQINSIIGTSVPVTIVKSLFTAIAVGLLLISIAFLKPFDRYLDDQSLVKVAWPRTIKWLLCFAGAGLIISALSGYIGFSRFVAQQIVVTGAVIATMYLGIRTARAISEESAFVETSLGKKFLHNSRLTESGVDQLGLIVGFAVTALVLAVGLPLLALMWGFQWLDIERFVISAFTEIQIGSISLSISSILIGVVLFSLGLLLTRYFKSWLDGNILSRSRMDPGARSSITTAVGYIGVAIAGLFGVTAAGIELSQLALIAGALSLGIGFGLQNIVSNFVSGLILLAERPFKAGDIVEAGGFTGVVKVVKVRATEIETFDKKTLVLPNSEMINSAVINWMHKTALGRVSVAVGVSYDSDAQAVHDLLIEIAKDHPRVLANPEPFVDFYNFGDSALEFELRAYIADVGFSVGVKTELRIAIHQRFKEQGIEIPFPQRDVNLKVVGDSVSQVLGNAAQAAPTVIKTGKTPNLDD
ncbi:mechanosensitive ion channel domain-containing protein [Ahrensia kielensis]|uniref:mechanosensitive ion channel domain-containing protein n=1 Tax=Ahrensia kielensis TaxID=76980 RepID=UPI0003781DB9|nr:mechanosensitive ion channel domain-containing protein [Ahrensia kielensis]